MKRSYLAAGVVLVALLMAPFAVGAATVEGSIQGFNCVTEGKTCPIGQEDPMIATERVFVLYSGDDKYLFVSNLDRAILSRHINQRVRVTGEINEKYRSITAESFEVFRDGQWVTTWSTAMQDALKLRL